MRILIATKNSRKRREMEKFIGKDFEIVSLSDFPDAPDIDESGKTFFENALIKARAYFEWSGIPTVSDDGGLMIDTLNGEPGVLSRRWPSSAEATAGKPGKEKSDQELIDLALSKLQGVSQDKRAAHLVTVGVFYDGTHTLEAQGGIDGYIVEKQTAPCEQGYPFRCIFWIPKFNKLYQDLTNEEHEEINHRRPVYSELGKKILALAQ